MSEATPPSDHVIVVGVDGSDGSKDALHWAAHQAELTGASLRAVMTWELPLMAYGAAVPLPANLDLAGDSARVLTGLLADLGGAHPTVTMAPSIVEGHAAEVLIAESAHAELLVVGSRGHGSFAGLVLGSVSERCASHAACPVVIVRHGHAAGTTPA